MKWITGICLVIFIFFSGCSKEFVYVVLRDVPTHPSFAVIPANNFMDEVNFAQQVEASLIRIGVSVVERPAVKEVTRKTDEVAGQVQPDVPPIAKAGELSVTERFSAYEETNAGYILFTFNDSKRIRIVKRETKEVVASFDLNLHKIITVKKMREEEVENEQFDDTSIHDALQNLGIPVRP